MAEMENIRAQMTQKGQLVLIIDPKKKGELSGTGKSFVIARAHWFDLSGIEGCEGMKLHAQVIRVLPKNKKITQSSDPDYEDNSPPRRQKPKAKKVKQNSLEEDYNEKPTHNPGKKPNINRDTRGNVKPIAHSSRPADKLRTRRGS